MWQDLADVCQFQRSQVLTHVLRGRGLIFLLLSHSNLVDALNYFRSSAERVPANFPKSTSSSASYKQPTGLLYQARELTPLVMPHRYDRDTPPKLCADHLSREAACDGRSLQFPRCQRDCLSKVIAKQGKNF
jgi:hypothetical protein